MNFAHIDLSGNSTEDYLLSLAIFIASVLVGRYLYHLIQKRVSEWTTKNRQHPAEKNLVRAGTLASYLIPLVGLVVAKSRLNFTKSISFSLDNILIISGQIIFIVILFDILNIFVKSIAEQHLRNVQKIHPERCKEQKEYVEKFLTSISRLSFLVLILVTILTICDSIGFTFAAMYAVSIGIVIIKVALCYRIILLAKRNLKKKQASAKTVSDLTGWKDHAKENDPDASLRLSIVRFFLELFKIQSRAKAGAWATFRQVGRQSNNYIFELHVEVDGHKQSRRMTIGPLGEDSGSRSKCFCVIYDNHLVIKIPPNPINDLDDYIANLKKEAAIVDKLAMKECIVPRVSVILRMIYKFPEQAHLTSDEAEAQYLRFLRTHAEYQKYLRIDNTFVFFMDLSKYYFLQHVAKMLHDTDRKIYDEIHGHAEIIMDDSEIESQYGNSSLPIFLGIQRIYTKYQFDIRNILIEYGLAPIISQYEIRTFFLKYLFNNEFVLSNGSTSSEFISAMRSLLDRIITGNTIQISAYRKLLSTIVYEKNFAQNNSAIEAMATNLLELLAYLRQKSVAMRDLKPDNLLVAGDRQKYPGFLCYPNEYRIGLIDVETAVVLQTSRNIKTDQPRLGGTPQYATPSHFFRNEVLSHVFKDLGNILHLQDWHAITGIIFEVITGQFLFERTALIFPAILDLLRNSPRSLEESADVLERVSRMFWGNAVVEFRDNIAKKEKMLRSVNLIIPDSARKMLREYILEQKQNSAVEIKKYITSQTVFNTNKNIQYLLSASPEQVRLLRRRWMNGKGIKTTASINRAEVPDMLRALEKVKSQFELQGQVMELLKKPDCTISAYELLDLMFSIVQKHMYKENWQTLEPRDLSNSLTPRRGISCEATI